MNGRPWPLTALNRASDMLTFGRQKVLRWWIRSSCLHSFTVLLSNGAQSPTKSLPLGDNRSILEYTISTLQGHFRSVSSLNVSIRWTLVSQVWPLTQFYLLAFLSLSSVCLESYLMTPHLRWHLFEGPQRWWKKHRTNENFEAQFYFISISVK